MPTKSRKGGNGSGMMRGCNLVSANVLVLGPGARKKQRRFSVWGCQQWGMFKNVLVSKNNSFRLNNYN